MPDQKKKHRRQRYRALSRTIPIHFHPFAAVKEVYRKGYTRFDFKSDLLSGVIVGLIAIPLGMALAIASGVAPQQGLYTVIVGGFFAALLGGSRCQVTGPTAAFVVVLLPIVLKFGLSALLLAGFMAGILLALMGLFGMGKLIQYIPYPVTTGFTSGIAVVIGTLQLKDFLGLKPAMMPDTFFGKILALFHSRQSFSVTEFAVGTATLGILLFWPKLNKKIPAPLIALSAIACIAEVVQVAYPEIKIATIGTRFSGGIPQLLPQWVAPWGSLHLSVDLFQSLLGPAFSIAMLGAIESLLSAVVADGMAQTRHDPDAELFGLGIANMICPFFGGIAATGAIARTATNIRFGAKSPISAMIHSIFVLLVLLAFAPLVSYLPMAALAALLILVAYNMSEVKHFFEIVRFAPASDVTVLIICFVLTVMFDMVVGVVFGVTAAAFLFMKRMADVTSVSRVRDLSALSASAAELPKNVLLYEITGPLFFGAAQRAIDAVHQITDDVRVVIFVLQDVPSMDVSGLTALETAIKQLNADRRTAILTCLEGQPRELIQRSELIEHTHDTAICDTLEAAVQLAKVRSAAPKHEFK